MMTLASRWRAWERVCVQESDGVLEGEMFSGGLLLHRGEQAHTDPFCLLFSNLDHSLFQAVAFKCDGDTLWKLTNQHHNTKQLTPALEQPPPTILGHKPGNKQNVKLDFKQGFPVWIFLVPTQYSYFSLAHQLISKPIFAWHRSAYIQDHLIFPLFRGYRNIW